MRDAGGSALEEDGHQRAWQPSVGRSLIRSKRLKDFSKPRESQKVMQTLWAGLLRGLRDITTTIYNLVFDRQICACSGLIAK